MRPRRPTHPAPRARMRRARVGVVLTSRSHRSQSARRAGRPRDRSPHGNTGKKIARRPDRGRAGRRRSPPCFHGKNARVIRFAAPAPHCGIPGDSRRAPRLLIDAQTESGIHATLRRVVRGRSARLAWEGSAEIVFDVRPEGPQSRKNQKRRAPRTGACAPESSEQSAARRRPRRRTAPQAVRSERAAHRGYRRPSHRRRASAAPKRRRRWRVLHATSARRGSTDADPVTAERTNAASTVAGPVATERTTKLGCRESRPRPSDESSAVAKSGPRTERRVLGGRESGRGRTTTKLGRRTTPRRRSTLGRVIAGGGGDAGRPTPRAIAPRRGVPAVSCARSSGASATDSRRRGALADPRTRAAELRPDPAGESRVFDPHSAACASSPPASSGSRARCSTSSGTRTGCLAPGAPAIRSSTSASTARLRADQNREPADARERSPSRWHAPRRVPPSLRHGPPRRPPSAPLPSDGAPATTTVPGPRDPSKTCQTRDAPARTPDPRRNPPPRQPSASLPVQGNTEIVYREVSWEELIEARDRRDDAALRSRGSARLQRVRG
jgi:hypothetical protein